jgi:branched-chain amino acid transport system ATP-binding protein
MLNLYNVEVLFQNSILVLKGVSMEVSEGSVVALMGANGAGKTTTLKAVFGMLKDEEGEVSSGKIEFNGVRIDHAEPHEIAKMGIVQVMEGRRVLEHLTVDQNLKVGSHLRKDNAAVEQDLRLAYDYFPGLVKHKHRISGWLSGGEQQMLVIGRALMAKPKVILLDEPSVGLAPLLVNEIFRILQRLNTEQKLTIFVVEQNVKMALSIADFGYVLENGRVVLDGPTSRLKDNEDIKEFYLGLSRVGERKSYKAVKHYKRRKRWLG